MYYKLYGSNDYRIRIQNTKTYKYIVDNVFKDIDDIDQMLTSLKSKYQPSYLCEVKY